MNNLSSAFSRELLEQIVQAHGALRPMVPVTALDYSPLLSARTGCEVYLKCEHQQPMGSFKFRGANNKLRLLTEGQRQRGVIAASSGNHGKAMAMAGKQAGLDVTIYASTTASAAKLEAIRALGAQLVLVPGDTLAAEMAAKAAAEQQHKVYISPYNDLQVVAGQGTCGMELLEQQPDLAAVFVAVGGGGLIGGIGTVLKAYAPQTQVIGCWPANATSMHRCLEEGKIIEVAEQETLSDGTAGGIAPDAVTFPLCQQVIDQHLLVSEPEIKQAMRLLASTDNIMIEGAAGVALAAALQQAEQFHGQKIAIILCGKNIVLEKYLQALAG